MFSYSKFKSWFLGLAIIYCLVTCVFLFRCYVRYDSAVSQDFGDYPLRLADVQLADQIAESNSLNIEDPIDEVVEIRQIPRVQNQLKAFCDGSLKSLPDPTKNGRNSVEVTSYDVAERAIHICAGSQSMHEIVAQLCHLSSVGCSSQIVIAHCDEFEESQKLMLNLLADVLFLDICKDRKKDDSMRKWFRSWYCKPLAVVKSPYQKVMLLDLDTIWFKNPDNLWKSDQFTSHGSLFFNDKMFRSKNLRRDKLESFFKRNDGNLSEKSKKKLYERLNSSSKIWRGYSHEDQESSCVMLDKKSHSGTIEKLAEISEGRIIPGYGDKEAYWTSAFLAGEEAAFSTWSCSHFGSSELQLCRQNLHYDPTDIDSLTSQPMFMNAHTVAQLDRRDPDKFMKDLDEVKFMSKPVSLKDYEARNISSPCVHKVAGAVETPEEITTIIKLKRELLLRFYPMFNSVK